MDRRDLADPELFFPYLAAAGTALAVLLGTILLQHLGPSADDASAAMWFRVGGGWIALLMGALVWMIVSEPIRLQKKIDEATERLQASKEQFRQLYDHAPLTYLILDEEGTIERANVRSEEFLGYPTSELEGRSILDLFSAHEPGREKATEAFQRFRRGEPVKGEELKLETADGDLRWVTLTVRALPDTEDTDSSRALSMFMDITERKRAKMSLEYHARELERSNEDLEQFADVVSHDLKEPLRMVESYLQLVESRFGDEIPEEALGYLGHAADGADRMEELIESLLEYSQVGTSQHQPERVDLDEVVQEVARDLQFRIDETGGNLVIDDLPTVEGDPTQLRQVLQNLVSNGLKYGGDEPTVRVTAQRQGPSWEIRIDDDGPGVPPDERESVFEVFQRGKTNGGEGGTGIGLAIAKRIVERHGGRIEVRESPEGGARFAFTLPDEPGPRQSPIERPGTVQPHVHDRS